MSSSPESIRRAARRTRSVMAGKRLNFNAVANNAGIVFKNKKLPKNAVNIITMNTYGNNDKGKKFVQYAPNRYAEFHKFTRYLSTLSEERGGGRKYQRPGEKVGTSIPEILSNNGNRVYLSPEGIPFKKSNLKFFIFV